MRAHLPGWWSAALCACASWVSLLLAQGLERPVYTMTHATFRGTTRPRESPALPLSLVAGPHWIPGRLRASVRGQLREPAAGPAPRCHGPAQPEGDRGQAPGRPGPGPDEEVVP